MEKEQIWYAIINPKSGGKRGEKVWKQASALLKDKGAAYESALTQHAGHAIELADQAVKAGYRKLIVVGGDGTLNEVVNGIYQNDPEVIKDVTMGMIAIGTGNDWIKTMEIPHEVEEAVNCIVTGNTRIIDVGEATSVMDGKNTIRYFVNVAGMAFDAAVTKHANDTNKEGGKVQYVLSLITQLFQYQPTNVTLEVDGEVHQSIAFSLCVGNCKYSGGGMKMVPNAKPDDGLFDVTFFKNFTKMGIVKNVPRLFTGKILHLKEVDSFLAKNVKVDSDERIYLEAEGEVLGHNPFEFNIIPNGIRVVVP